MTLLIWELLKYIKKTFACYSETSLCDCLCSQLTSAVCLLFQDETVAAALAYIDSQLDTLEDTYSMALLAYAYALAGSDRFDDVYKKLQELAVESGRRQKHFPFSWLYPQSIECT